MDGLKARLTARLNQSLQFRLSFYLTLTSLAVALIAGIVSFASALSEAHELQDSMLRQISVLASFTPSQYAGPASAELSPSDEDEETRVTVQWLPAPGMPTAPRASPSNLSIPTGISDGLHTLAFDGEDFRVVVRSLKDGSRVVVAQEAGMRNDIARSSALRTIAPLLVLAPLLVMMVAVLVRRLLAPISRLSDEVNARPEQALHPVDVEGVPVELRTFLDAINGLLAKVKQSMDLQRRFLADAAHELRSPLTALSLQSERMAQAEMSGTVRERLETLRQGIERGRHLLEQLLSLARAQATSLEPQQVSTSVSARDICRRAIEDFVSQAESKSIDLGMTEGGDAVLSIDELTLVTIVKNLVDNAVRYSPQGSRVDLGVRAFPNAVCISVSDHGPGIPEDERGRVFDPFYRVLGAEEGGSGLGLAIVRELADRVGATVDLAYTDVQSQQGLTATLRLPICPALS